MDSSVSSWIGVDLDGTLAEYNYHWKGPEHIGAPIPAMVERVKKWMSEGKQVKIFTARASDPNAIPIIEKWLEENGIGGLEITNVKDYTMEELWDDRVIQVIPNTGEPIDGHGSLLKGINSKEKDTVWILSIPGLTSVHVKSLAQYLREELSDLKFIISGEPVTLEKIPKHLLKNLLEDELQEAWEKGYQSKEEEEGL